MKVFTLDEANQLLPRVKPLLRRLQNLHESLKGQREAARLASAQAENGGGGIPGGGGYVSRVLEFSEIIRALDGWGVQIKDFERGLIDFPAWREGRVVLLCWQLGEGDEIEWWHDVEAGFAGRQPL